MTQWSDTNLRLLNLNPGMNAVDNAAALTAPVAPAAYVQPAGPVPPAATVMTVDTYRANMVALQAQLARLQQQVSQLQAAPQRMPAPPSGAPLQPRPEQPAARPQRAPEPAAPQAGPASGTQVKEGHRLPTGFGRATTFWNGHYGYKGRHDGINAGKGAWGDANKPTDYMCALPVGLKGGGDWWHNQKILITNPTTGKQVVVLVQDKGPHPKTGAVVDLSPVAKEALGVKFMDNLDVRIAFADPGTPVGPVS